MIAVACCLLSATHARGQDISPENRAKLTRAEKTADAFVEEYRRTLNFAPVWKEFRAENFACRLIKSDVVTAVSDEEKQRLGIPLLEKAYVALMNYFYLKGVHDLSFARIDSDNSDEHITPREILDSRSRMFTSRKMASLRKLPETSSNMSSSSIDSPGCTASICRETR